MASHGRHTRSRTPDDYAGVSWMQQKPRKTKAVVTGVLTTVSESPSAIKPSPKNPTPSQIPKPSTSKTLPASSPTASTSAQPSSPPGSLRNDTTVFISSLPKNLTQKSFFSHLTCAYPSLRCAEVSLFSSERTARLRIPAEYSRLLEGEDKKRLDNRLGEICCVSIRRPHAQAANTNTETKRFSFSVVIRGVDLATSEEDIREGLEFAGHRIDKIYRIRSRQTGKPTTLMRVISKDRETIHHLLHEGVISFGKRYRVEPSHPPRAQPAQCRRCQGFNHLTQECRKDLRCARCGACHRSAACDAEILKCANCGGGHHSGDFRCPQRPKDPAGLGKATPVTTAHLPSTDTAEPGEAVSRRDLLRLLSILLANLHPGDRPTVAGLLDEAARDVLGYSVHPVYSWNQQYAAVAKMTPSQISG